jgi:hypothetical protein
VEETESKQPHRLFSVGNLRVHGVGALCSFGVAVATFCIFLLGGGRQQQNRQNHKSFQLQMYADDEVGGSPYWQFHYFLKPVKNKIRDRYR